MFASASGDADTHREMALESVVGRERELETVASFLGLETTAGRVLILEGEAGIGKTTLWRAGVDAAHELSQLVLRASPAEREATFAYSVVSDLLEDVLDEVLAELPEPQRRALEVALLRKASDGSPPEQHTLGVALLAVLRTLAASRPVLLAVDDVQWLRRRSVGREGPVGAGADRRPHAGRRRADAQRAPHRRAP